MATETDTQRSDRSFADKYLGGSLAALLILAGLVLFLFPEPMTSTLGIALVVLGLVALVVEWLRS